MPAQDNSPIPTKLGRYKIVAELGRELDAVLGVVHLLLALGGVGMDEVLVDGEADEIDAVGEGVALEFLQRQPQVGQSLHMRGLALQDGLVQRHRELQPVRAGGQRGLEVERRHFMRGMQARQGQQSIGLLLGLIPFGPVVQGHGSFIQSLRLGHSWG